MDGTARAPFKILVPNAQPHDVEIDLGNRQLYWNEYAGGAVGSTVVNKTRLDGLGPIELVVNPSSLSASSITANGIHFDTVQDAVYFHLSGDFPNQLTIPNQIGLVQPDGTGLNTPVTRSLETFINYMETTNILPNADFDNDGDVDGDDFLLWQVGYPADENARHLFGDADFDGDVDGDDFLIWQSQFGGASGAGTVSAVPEPAALGTAVIGLAAICLSAAGRLPRSGRQLVQ